MVSNFNPLVCVCVPSYNSEVTIARSLESILCQTYKNIRIILVDNASTDNTVKIAESYAEKDIRLEIFKSNVNIGAERNYTRCIHLSSGEYTAIYHADDVYNESIIEEEVEFLEVNKEAGAVFSSAWEINSLGTKIGIRNIPKCLADMKKRAYVFENILRAILKCGNFMIFPSAMVRTQIYKNKIHAWNEEKYRTSADLDVWLRIAENHAIGIIDKPLIKYRISEISYSYNHARLRNERQDLFLVLKDYVKKYKGSIIKERELADYKLLILKDDINIAINCIIRGEKLKARKLLKGIFDLDNIRNSLIYSTQLKILLIGYIAWFLSILPSLKILRNLLSKIRHKG